MLQIPHWEGPETPPRHLGHHVPPFDGQGLTADIGATVHISRKDMVGKEIIDEGAGEPQGLQQGPNGRWSSAQPGARPGVPDRFQSLLVPRKCFPLPFLCPTSALCLGGLGGAGTLLMGSAA